MGELRNCPVCGKVFVKLNRNLCPECMDKDEQEFEQVRKYLKENPGAGVKEIAEAAEVTEDKVLKWMREGRIDIEIRGGGSGLSCKRCGERINSGNLCSKCAQSLATQFNSASRETARKIHEADKAQETKSRGMFVIDRLREGE